MADPQAFFKLIAKIQRKPLTYPQKATATKWSMAAVVLPREQGQK